MGCLVILHVMQFVYLFVGDGWNCLIRLDSTMMSWCSFLSNKAKYTVAVPLGHPNECAFRVPRDCKPRNGTHVNWYCIFYCITLLQDAWALACWQVHMPLDADHRF